MPRMRAYPLISNGGTLSEKSSDNYSVMPGRLLLSKQTAVSFSECSSSNQMYSSPTSIGEGSHASIVVLIWVNRCLFSVRWWLATKISQTYGTGYDSAFLHSEAGPDKLLINYKHLSYTYASYLWWCGRQMQRGRRLNLWRKFIAIRCLSKAARSWYIVISTFVHKRVWSYRLCSW